jgi:hypothetical protein
MRQDKKGWYHTASRIFTVICALATVLLILGILFCVQDYFEAKAAGETYDLLRMIVEGLVVCGMPALISGLLAVRFRDRGI